MNLVEIYTADQHINVRQAFEKLNVAPDAILFVVDVNNVLLGSLTDGDLRRGFMRGLNFDNEVIDFVQPHPAFISLTNYKMEEIEKFRRMEFKVLPIVNDQMQVMDIFSFRFRKGLIPADAVLMAGGEGKRLRPLTAKTPKPLLIVGDKPIIEHNIDRLIQSGIKNIYISINYLGEQLESYFNDGSQKGVNIQYVKEPVPLGTIGSIMMIDDFQNDDIIVMNSDLLTNIDFIDFYKEFKEKDADMAVAATSYNVDVPYAVMEICEENLVRGLKEKPRYTYYSNAGIYLLKKEILSLIPKGDFFNVTDLMEKAISEGRKVLTYPITGYWLDIGKHDDFKKAQEDFKHIEFD